MLSLALPAGVVVALWLHRLFEGEMLVLDLVDELRLWRMPLPEADRRWAGNPNRSPVVVSLTTIPSRLPHLDATLKSLLLQSRAPAQIRLHCPRTSRREGVAYLVPERLRHLQGVQVVECERDWGPATKFIPALLALAAVDPAARLLVVDDDRLYPLRLIEELSAAADRDPEGAYSMSGWDAPADRVDRPTTIGANLRMRPPAPIRGTRLLRPRRVDILQGMSGYLISPRFFDLDALTDYSAAPPAALSVDDVWMSAHCRVPRFVIPTRRSNCPVKLSYRVFDRSSLGRTNRGGGAPLARPNTILLRHFSERWRTPATP
jgi:hypothetical protein